MRLLWLLALVACQPPSTDKVTTDRTVVTDTTTDGTTETDTGADDHTGLGLECPGIPPAAVAQEVNVSCTGTSVFAPLEAVVEWRWSENTVSPGATDIMMTPITVNLTDDDDDGTVDENDVPDLVFNAFIGRYEFPRYGPIVALSGADGSLLWSLDEIPGVGTPGPTTGLAAGDLDGDGVVELVGSTYRNEVFAFHPPGAGGVEAELVWITSPVTVLDRNVAPALADFEADGTVEVAVGPVVFEHDGSIRFEGASNAVEPPKMMSVPADVDGDGLLELVSGNSVYNYDGSVRFQDEALNGYTIFTNADADPALEYIRTANQLVELLDDDYSVLWSQLAPELGGGNAVVADFDGDGQSEFGVAYQLLYRVFEMDGTLLWEAPMYDGTSVSLGSTAFDFDGDGAFEILLADESTLWVYDGATGAVEFQWDDHGSGTAREYPYVVDIDHDGAGEIILASNDYWIAGVSGVTVLGAATGAWPPAPAIWNQYSYHTDNVNADGSIPQVQAPGPATHNTYRAALNDGPIGLVRPDWRIGAPDHCLDECGRDRVVSFVPVENVGAFDGGAVSVVVDAAESGSVVFDAGVVPVGGQVWVGPVTLSEADYAAGVTVSVRPGSVPPDGEQCDTTNDVVVWTSSPCP